MYRLLLAFVLLPSIAFANVTRERPRQVEICVPSYTVSNGGVRQYVWPYASSRLVDVVVYQLSAGVGGTSWSAMVRDDPEIEEMP